ncbi:MAG TPA: TlpA disulfide reductase family protein [Terracidiphilus sp.]|nr:TlpA disulfide reductase family protein [Terracidiphilus sp.]
MRSLPIRRNTLVLCAVIFLLAVFAWAGWANWEYRQQAAERSLILAEHQGELIADASVAADPGTPLANAAAGLQGKPAPAFVLENLDGKKVSLASFRGKAVLLNFWATWCGPCKIETPWLVALRDKYASQGFEVLGVDTEGDDLAPGDKAGWAKDKAEVDKFVQQMKMPYPVLINGDSISAPYGGLDALPTSFFIDRKGTVVAAQMGLSSESDMEANIKKALTQ